LFVLLKEKLNCCNDAMIARIPVLLRVVAITSTSYVPAGTVLYSTYALAQITRLAHRGRARKSTHADKPRHQIREDLFLHMKTCKTKNKQVTHKYS
jgi:hypothetical protein